MTTAQPKDYWISPNALYIERNALGNPDYIQANSVSGAVIMCYIKGIAGLDIDASHNPRRWVLQASPTIFNTHTEKYIYVAIPRNNTFINAQVVFPSEEVDIYGKNAAEEQIGSEDYYYIYLQAALTSSGDNGTINREWRNGKMPDMGFLDTYEQRTNPTESEWYEYSDVSGILTFLKNLTMKVGTLFINLFAHKLQIKSYGEDKGSITFENGNGSIEKVAVFGKASRLSGSSLSAKEIVTPAYLSDREAEVEKKYLRKDQNDKTEFDLEMKNLKVNGKADVFGNFVAESTTHLKGNVTIGSPSATVPDASASGTANMQHWGKSQWGMFIKGIIGGSGAQIDINGNAELESLIVRKFLEVPELRYNRVSVHSGTEWFTKGSGIIESVEPIDDTHGKVKLHLEDGEISTIAVDDYCMGIFHNLKGNATETTDDKQGTMQFAGFTTVYFRIQEITETAHNSEFIYELRHADSYQGSLPTGEGGGRGPHPQPQMTFACYANPNREDRQSAVLKTTDYTVYIEKSTQWTFGADNYYLIMGNLDGFSVWATNKKGERYLKHLHGNGTMLGNVYMFGVIDQFDRLADIIEVTASPRINADFTIADGETLTLTAQMQSYDGIKRTGVVYSIKRYSDNHDSDAEWNERRGNDIAGGTIDLTTEDTLIATVPDASASGSIYDPAVQFTISATRTLPSEEGGDDYTVERDVVMKNVGRNTIILDNTDSFMTLNVAKHINFLVISPRGEDITKNIARWSILRHSSSAQEDLLWQQRDKVKSFNGSIDLIWSNNVNTNDFDSNESINYTEFVVTAYDVNDTPVAKAKTTL